MNVRTLLTYLSAYAIVTAFSMLCITVAQAAEEREFLVIGEVTPQHLLLCKEREHMQSVLTEAMLNGSEAATTRLNQINLEKSLCKMGRVVVRLVRAHESYMVDGEPLYLIEVRVMAVVVSKSTIVPVKPRSTFFGFSTVPVVSEQEKKELQGIWL